MAAVRAALREAGLIARDYAGHSFRIGAATTAARQVLQDLLRRWAGRRSFAYTKYIRTAPETLRDGASGFTSSSLPLLNIHQTNSHEVSYFYSALLIEVFLSSPILC